MSMPFEFSEVLTDKFDGLVDERYANYEGGTDYTGLATSLVGAGTSIAGAVSQNKASKEASLSPLDAEVLKQCGKDKSRSWSKRKQSEYIDCKNSVTQKYGTTEQKKANRVKLNQLNTKLRAERETAKRNMYIVLGILAVGGFYLYMKSKKSK